MGLGVLDYLLLYGSYLVTYIVIVTAIYERTGVKPGLAAQVYILLLGGPAIWIGWGIKVWKHRADGSIGG